MINNVEKFSFICPRPFYFLKLFRMNKIKVVVVEDLDEIRQGFSFLINSSEEIDCIGSYVSAEDALKAIKKNTPDVMIMDIGLPGMSGIECTMMVKKMYPAVQIMICTVYEDDERLFNALAAGASGYILKRSAPELLIESIKDMYHGGSPMSNKIARKVVEALRGSLPAKINAEKNEEDFHLSKREIEILDLLSVGYRNKEISEKLFISAHTVKSHIYHIYEKLHVRSRTAALNKYSSKKI